MRRSGPTISSHFRHPYRSDGQVPRSAGTQEQPTHMDVGSAAERGNAKAASNRRQGG